MVPPRNVTAFEGGRVRFTCEAEGFPTNVSYQWYHNGALLRPLDEIYPRKATVFANGTLVLNATSKEDAGWYSCRPTNGLGTAPEASAYLNITCRLCYHSLGFISRYWFFYSPLDPLEDLRF